MTQLLSSLESCVLFVDPRKQHAECLSEESRQHLRLVFSLLSDAISVARVPCHLVVDEEEPNLPELLFAPSFAPEPTLHAIRPDGPAWSNSGLATALAATKRGSLAICGFWLETKVSFFALCALSAGFDVFLVTDAAPSRVQAAREPSIARLLQAGVTTTSSHQLLAEWAEQSSDPALRAGLAALVANT